MGGCMDDAATADTATKHPPRAPPTMVKAFISRLLSTLQGLSIRADRYSSTLAAIVAVWSGGKRNGRPRRRRRAADFNNEGTEGDLSAPRVLRGSLALPEARARAGANGRPGPRPPIR